MTAPSVSARRGAEGFVLPIVAVAIAVFALSVLTLVSTIDAASVRVTRLQEDAAFARQAASAEARVSFLLATEPLRAGAVAVGADRNAPSDSPLDLRDRRILPVHLDGRAYVTIVDRRQVVVRLQDTAGLLNVNGADPARLARLLAATGDEGAATRAAALVADFTDPDDARRPGGAERAEYVRRGFDPPIDMPIDDVRRVHDVLNWDDLVTAAQMAELERFARAAPAEAGLNVNTAPAPVIAAAFGIDAARAAEIVRRRAAQPVRTTDDLAAIAGGGLQLEGQPLAAAPDRTQRLTVSATGPDGLTRRMTTSLIFAVTLENPPIGVGPRDISPDPEQRSSDERLEPLPAGGRFPPR